MRRRLYSIEEITGNEFMLQTKYCSALRSLKDKYSPVKFKERLAEDQVLVRQEPIVKVCINRIIIILILSGTDSQLLLEIGSLLRIEHLVRNNRRSHSDRLQIFSPFYINQMSLNVVLHVSTDI